MATDAHVINTRTIKVRIEADQQLSEKLAGQFVQMLERLGYEVIEWSRAFPLREDPERARSYVSALPGDKESEEK